MAELKRRKDGRVDKRSCPHDSLAVRWDGDVRMCVACGRSEFWWHCEQRWFRRPPPEVLQYHANGLKAEHKGPNGKFYARYGVKSESIKHNNNSYQEFRQRMGEWLKAGDSGQAAYARDWLSQHRIKVKA